MKMIAPHEAPRMTGIALIALVLLAGSTALVFSKPLASGLQGVGIGGGFQTQPFGRPDAETALLCRFNNSTNCLHATGSITPIYTNLQVGEGGAFSTNGAFIPEKGVASAYPIPGFNPAKGTIEAWINPAPTGRDQYVFYAPGGKSQNGDSYNDLIFGETGPTPTPNTSHIFFGTGNGLDFDNPAHFPSHVIRGISSGDVDGDGIPDMVVSNNAANEIWVFPGPFIPGETRANPEPSHRLPIDQPQGNTLVDLDGDGDLDLGAASYGINTVPVMGWENDGQGNFTLMEFGLGTFFAPAEGIEIVNLNGDTIPDFVYGSFTEDLAKPSVAFYGRIGLDGKYSIGIESPENYEILEYGILGIHAADLDQDGWNDLIFAKTGSNQIVIRMNDQTGRFPNDAEHRIIVPTSRPFVVGARDMDNDGHLDILTANYKPGATVDNAQSTVFLGPEFTQTLSYDVMNAVSFSVGDMDGDGLKDIVYHSSTGGECPVYYLDETGTVKGSHIIPCQPTYGNPGGPGSGVYAAIKGSTPYGRSYNRANEMELVYDSENEEIVFAVFDAEGKRHETRTPFIANGMMQKIQAEWNLNKGRLRIMVGNPFEGGTTHLYMNGEPITWEGMPSIYHLGTGPENQNALKGILDEVRVSTIVRSGESTQFT